ncbi:FGGY family carbohydrate kinase [Porticoccus sp.]|uniref:FGGY family carbohydrate kinase n=1 Tax=Porticoccus sp. TaxID=2024853 RepID=UPI003F69C151
MNDSLYLVIDQGGQSSRALVFDAHGTTTLLLRRAVATRFIAANRVEQVPADVVNSIRELLVDVADRLGPDLRRLQSAALVTQRSSLVCWHRQTGEPLSPVISWQDTRAAAYLADIKLDPAAIADLTGLRPNAHYGASKLRWCMEHIPAVSEAMDADQLLCGPLASYLLSAITREHSVAIDPGNAQRTLLWHIHRGDWDETLLSQFAIPRRVLPPVCFTQSDFGDLDLGGKAVPLALMNGDQNAAFFGVGPLQSDRLYINAGTGAFIAMPWPADDPAPAGLLKTLVYQSARQRLFVAEGTVNGAASALDSISAELGVEDYPRFLGEWCQTERDVPLFLNGVGGLGAPWWQSDFQSRFIGEGSAAGKLVAVLESVVFLLMVNLTRLREDRDPVVEIVVGGGLSMIDGFCQRLADLSGLIVLRSGETESTARGAAFLLAGQPGDWRSVFEQFKPQPDGTIKQRYTNWLKAMADATAMPV